MAISKYYVIGAFTRQYKIKQFLSVIKSVCVPITYVLVNCLHSATDQLSTRTWIFPLKCCTKIKENKQDAFREETCWDSTWQMTLTYIYWQFFYAQNNVLAAVLSECKVRWSYTNWYMQRWSYLTLEYCYHCQEFLEVISGCKWPPQIFDNTQRCTEMLTKLEKYNMKHVKHFWTMHIWSHPPTERLSNQPTNKQTNNLRT